MESLATPIYPTLLAFFLFKNKTKQSIKLNVHACMHTKNCGVHFLLDTLEHETFSVVLWVCRVHSLKKNDVTSL